MQKQVKCRSPKTGQRRCPPKTIRADGKKTLPDLLSKKDLGNEKFLSSLNMPEIRCSRA